MFSDVLEQRSLIFNFFYHSLESLFRISGSEISQSLELCLASLCSPIAPGSSGIPPFVIAEPGGRSRELKSSPTGVTEV